jgi:catechol-2,3-dioxygenase
MDLKLQTIIIFVEDVDRLKIFYVNILQLEIVEEQPSQWLLLKAGNCHIGLHKMGQQYLDETKPFIKFDSNTKIVFETEEDIHALREKLIALNVLLQEVKTFDNYGFWLCDGEDPEGNVFQIRQLKK